MYGRTVVYKFNTKNIVCEMMVRKLPSGNRIIIEKQFDFEVEWRAAKKRERTMGRRWALRQSCARRACRPCEWETN